MINIVFLEFGDTSSSQRLETFEFHPNNWDDFGFKTTFFVTYVDRAGTKFKIGTTRVAYRGQVDGWTLDHVRGQTSPVIFSLGQDVEYYQRLRQQLDPSVVDLYLKTVGDVAAHDETFRDARDEAVFRKSLMRDVSLSTIVGQYRRVIEGKPVLTPFRFRYKDPGGEDRGAFNLYFGVNPGTRPSTNIHVLIGRNGVGKTTILNNMVRSIVAPDSNRIDRPNVVTVNEYGVENDSDLSEFSSVVSVSFSAFDPFDPPSIPQDRSSKVAYFYVGMQDIATGLTGQEGPNELKTVKEKRHLRSEFVKALMSCMTTDGKRERWSDAIERLETDRNFKDLALRDLIELQVSELTQRSEKVFDDLSSGHAIVLLTMTKLVAFVEERTLVLIDEPESHLHPPLLSSFIRALSDLLNHRNGVAVIATHSPVVLQEVPRLCGWVVSRVRSSGSYERPPIETFGENVGVLTRAVFGLEVAKSGFHELLQKAVDEGGSFDDIFLDFGEQLGFEAQAQLRAMLRTRDEARGGDQ